MVKKYLETSRKIFAVHLESCCSTLGHISCAVASMAVTLLAMCSSRKVLSSAATCRPIRGEDCGHVTRSQPITAHLVQPRRHLALAALPTPASPRARVVEAENIILKLYIKGLKGTKYPKRNHGTKLKYLQLYKYDVNTLRAAACTSLRR